MAVVVALTESLGRSEAEDSARDLPNTGEGMQLGVGVPSHHPVDVAAWLKRPCKWATACWRPCCSFAHADEPGRARHVGDFIAGMTDRYALKTYERLVGPSPLPSDILI